MVLIDYIDPIKATKAILADWRDQEWRAENDVYRIKELNAKMTSVKAAMGSDPVAGGGSRREEMLCAAIDKKTAMEYGYKRALSFVEEVQPCWNRLSDDERFVLTARFIDRGEGGGIKRIMEHYGIEKSEAYEKCNAALKHLSKLIFW